MKGCPNEALRARARAHACARSHVHVRVRVQAPPQQILPCVHANAHEYAQCAHDHEDARAPLPRDGDDVPPLGDDGAPPHDHDHDHVKFSCPKSLC